MGVWKEVGEWRVSDWKEVKKDLLFLGCRELAGYDLFCSFRF